ncbi:hypothetical protein Glove_345g41 [Diversispora epigaea]|uniref:Protein kinase domain-containing protein n=1 Tax=Diversispora epigaea TaxID=1348612 RepID=A0A397HN37_9GLOM|nr:hypothetical protein Glove_345g41 [Diversispora epigaea]
MHIYCSLDIKKYGKCNECQQDNTGEDWCNTCNRERFQIGFDSWKGGNVEIDQFIQQTQLNANKCEEVIEWIPFDKFDNVEYLAEGGFGKIYKAKWSDGYIKCWKNENWKRMRYPYICLKSLNTYTSTTTTTTTTTTKNSFLQEIKNQLKFRGGWAIAIYGITFNPIKNEYMMVLQYAECGSLRNMLNNNFKDLTWESKIANLFLVIVGLAKIHECGLAHKDLHSGNIVNTSITNSYITDFGLCKPISENDQEKIYGVIPFMAPETLGRGEYTQKSDIYSFGMIMLEVFTSYPPYYNIPHDEKLVMFICEGHKPEIKCEIPQSLKHLMEKCWDTDPSSRPTAKELEIQLKEYSYYSEKFWSNDKANIKFIQYDPKKTHPQAIYTSRNLSFLKSKKVETNIHGTKQWDLEIPDDIREENEINL